MGDDKVKIILKLGALWQEFLRLTHWEVTIVMRNKIPGDRMAMVKANYRYKTAEIEISSTVEEDEIERVIVHELLHLPIGGVRAVSYKFMERITPTEHDLMLDAEESAVELLSRVFTDTFSYLDIAKKETKEDGQTEKLSWY